MDIFDSPLNKAHHYSRKADKYSEKGLLDEACEFHDKAAQLLLDALKTTNNATAIESIELQRQCHLRKQEIIRLRKYHQEAVVEAERVKKEVMTRTLKTLKKTESEEERGVLQKAIYRTFDEADSLLDILGHRNEPEATSTSAAVISTGSKRPKDDTVVIEELRIVNYQLRSLIRKLMAELSASESHVTALQARIAELEGNPPNASFEKSPLPGLETITTEPLPYNFSNELHEEIPALAPLELPNFDGSGTI